MTRQEFIENVTSFGELLDFCYEHDMYDYTDNIISYDSISEFIWDEIHDWQGSWESLGEALNAIDSGHDWYRRDGYLDYEWLDDSDFDGIKSDVLDEADSCGYFDEEEFDEDIPCSQSLDDQEYYLDPMTGERLPGGRRLESADMPDFLALM